jgi:hypothetical protein
MGILSTDSSGLEEYRPVKIHRVVYKLTEVETEVIDFALLQGSVGRHQDWGSLFWGSQP